MKLISIESDNFNGWDLFRSLDKTEEYQLYLILHEQIKAMKQGLTNNLWHELRSHIKDSLSNNLIMDTKDDR